jgi:hypothetical protein
MKPMTMPALAALILSLPALAVAETDANADGVLTLEEVLVAHPELTEESFASMDANGDGVLDADEVAIAQEAGILPASDG